MRNKLFAVFSTTAGVAVLIALALGLKFLLPRSGQVAPGAPSASPTPEISTAGLQEVAFSFDMEKCAHDAGEWDTSADLDISIDKVMVSSTDWKVGERWLVEGHYTLDAGSFSVAIIQDYDGTSRFHTSGDHTLSPGAGDFRLLYELLEITGTVASENLTLHIYNSESDDDMRCPIDIHDAVPSPQGQFQWPTSHSEISGWTFHDPRNPEYTGIDIAAAEGDPVVSVAAGEVTFAGEKGDYGNLVIVEHADGWSSYYAQLDELAVDVGQRVTQGEMLGKAGATGNSSGPHLHFELHYKGYPADPLDHLPSPSDLRDLLLQEDELPGTAPEGDDWEPEAIRLDGEDWVRDIARSDSCLEALKVEGFRQMEEGEGGVYVWNGVYRFATAQQAREQYEELLARDALASGEPLYERMADGGMEATTMAFTGSEGDAIYWLFGVEEETIHLLMVDSFGYEAAREVFEATMSQVLAR